MAMYETQEVKKVIPEDVRPILWFMLQELDSPSPNYHFELSAVEIGAERKQKVIHTQKNISYHREFIFKCPAPINAEVYIIGFDNNWLMTLPL